MNTQLDVLISMVSVLHLGFFFQFFHNSFRQISWKNRLLRVVISCFDRCGFVFSRFVVFCFLFFSYMQCFGVSANEMEILCNYRKIY